MIYAGGHLTILESVDSTNNYAMARVRAGLAKHGDAFFAMTQSAGKGQRGKTWLTERGTNIIITLVMRPEGLLLRDQFRFSAGVALGTHDFFSTYAGDKTSVKWPNDIYWNDRKAGGILIENVVAGAQEGWQWAIAGIGLNINQTSFPQEIRNPVSLKQITGKEWNVIELAKELCSRILSQIETLLTDTKWLGDYNERLYKKGQAARFRQGNRVFEATVKKVNALGKLVIDTGIEEQFGFGTIEWVL